MLNVIVPRFIEQTARALALGRPVTRDMAGRAMTYLQARTHYGVVDAAALRQLEPIWAAVLGAGDVKALDDLYARTIWIADGDNPALDTAAEEYRAIIGPPDPAGGGGEGDDSADVHLEDVLPVIDRGCERLEGVLLRAGAVAAVRDAERLAERSQRNPLQGSSDETSTSW